MATLQGTLRVVVVVAPTGGHGVPRGLAIVDGALLAVAARASVPPTTAAVRAAD